MGLRLATGRRADHVFEYRARHADGTVVWLLDYVTVVLGERGLPVRLRGLMLDITEQKLEDGSHADPPALQRPSPQELLAL